MKPFAIAIRNESTETPRKFDFINGQYIDKFGKTPNDYFGIVKMLEYETEQERETALTEISFYLWKNDFESAKTVRQSEGDKTCSYPEVEKQLYKMFGCQIHGIFNCSNDLCKGKEHA